MKLMRKLMVVLVAVLMVMSMTNRVSAEPGTPGITIQPGNDEDNTENLSITYTYYKILSASIDTDPVVGTDGTTTTDGVVAYYVVDENQATALTSTGLFKTTKVDGQNKWYVELIEKNPATTAEDIAAAFDNTTFLSKFTKQEYTFTKSEQTPNAVLPNITAGYYFVSSSLGTKVALQTLSPVTIIEKNQYPTITKEDDKKYAPIDGTVTYTVKVTIPETVASKPITIYDIITEGLTLNTAVTVTGAVEDPAYTSATFVADSTQDVAAVAASGNTPAVKAAKGYKLVIPAATVLANKGKTLTFTYTAKLNEKAVVLEEEINSAYLTYDNFEHVKKSADVTTLAFDIQKVDGTDKTTVLTGAEFKLYTASTGGDEIKVVLIEEASSTNGQINTYRVAKEGETGVAIKAGTARIEGLDNTTYYFEETAAPTSYNKLTERKAAAVTETTSTATVDLKIENNKGTQLPSTGGIGTTIFHVAGAALVLGAGIILISKKRANG